MSTSLNKNIVKTSWNPLTLVSTICPKNVQMNNVVMHLLRHYSYSPTHQIKTIFYFFSHVWLSLSLSSWATILIWWFVLVMVPRNCGKKKRNKWKRWERLQKNEIFRPNLIKTRLQQIWNTLLWELLIFR